MPNPRNHMPNLLPDSHFPSVLVSVHPTPCHYFHPSPAPLALLGERGSLSPKLLDFVVPGGPSATLGPPQPPSKSMTTKLGPWLN